MPTISSNLLKKDIKENDCYSIKMYNITLQKDISTYTARQMQTNMFANAHKHNQVLGSTVYTVKPINGVVLCFLLLLSQEPVLHIVRGPKLKTNVFL